MAMPEGPNVLVSRQAVLLATGVGVGLLTLVYVLGVQVGKQSAALQAGMHANGGELKELPAPLTEQLKAFELEAAELEKARVEGPKTEEARTESEPAASGPAASGLATAKSEPAKAEPKPAPPRPEKAAAQPPATPGERWSQQLVTTTDPAEAKRVAARAREAGFDTVEVRSGDTIRVRIKGGVPKAEADAAGARLKAKGLKPFAVRVE